MKSRIGFTFPFFGLLICLFVVLLSVSCKKEIRGSYKELKYILMECSDGSFIDEVSNNESDAPTIVSAEKVFRNFLQARRLEMQLLAPNYQANVEPQNTSATHDLDRWGSSFYSWSMDRASWDWAMKFSWDSGTGYDYRFPVLWDKRPDLAKGIVTFIPYPSPRPFSINENEFNKLLAAAKEWIEPEKVGIDELEERIRNGCGSEKAFAIRMLASKRDAGGIAMIESCLERDFSTEVQEAAFWTIREIGDKSAIPFLVKSFYRKNALIYSIVEAMCKIGGDQVGKELQDWLNDPEISPGRKKDIIYGIGIARYVPGKELIEPFLKSDDKDLKRAAEQAMERLSKE